MPIKFKYIDEALLKEKVRPCSMPGCAEAGEHRAPLSPSMPNEYQWMCKLHVAEFNKRWDYFRGMSQDEIEAFQKDATTGHRPTWRINEAARHSTDKLRTAFDRFMDHPSAVRAAPPINPRDRKALSDLDLDHPSTRDEIKSRYKKLVKQYHPDANPDDQRAEERFKQITVSYKHLLQSYAAS